jgi:C4-dicarboxylate-specific signal transduction histidine kinase
MLRDLTVSLQRAASSNGHAAETVFATIHAADRAALLRSLKTAKRAGKTLLMEMRVVGRSRKASFAARPACVKPAADPGSDQAGNGPVADADPGTQTSAQAFDERYQLTHLARVAMLGELSGALAHELQQPLTAILCNAQSAEYLRAKEPVDAVELGAILADITSEGKHAGEIIRCLRALLTPGATQVERVPLAELFRDVLAIVRGTLTERNVQLNIQSDEMVSAVRGDRVELQQVVLNLLLNACESMSGNGRYDRRIDVLASLDSDSRTVRISVMDCGPGIAPDRLERIFEPFVTTKQGGLGLGLSICRSIVAVHGGRLWATNRPDRGAAFHFTVPVAGKENPNEQSDGHSIHRR